MLQAVTTDGKIFIAGLFKRKELEAKREEKFYCPICNEEVVLKIGTVNTPHFAHKHHSDCQLRTFGEGEYHEKGKLQLYKWIKGQGIEVQLEAYIKEIQQYPDLLLTIGKRQIAIEYQCARIPISELQKRSDAYDSFGMDQIWILGGNNFNRISPATIQIDEFTKHFIHLFPRSHVPKLFYYCSQRNQFAIFEQLYFITKCRAFGSLSFKEISKINLTDLFTNTACRETELYSIWIEAKRRFRTKDEVYGKDLEFRKWLYNQSLHIENLPSYIYLPIEASYLSKSPIWQWQTHIVLRFLTSEQEFSLEECKAYLQEDFIEALPFIKVETACPIQHYLTMLVDLNIIEFVGDGLYKRKEKIRFYKNLHEALEGDLRFMQKLRNKE